MPDDVTATHPPNEPSGGLARPPLFLVLLSLVGHFLRFGYTYGDGDQDELVPAALHLLNSELFTADWLIQNVTSGINVRTYFVGLMAASGAAVPLWLGVAVLHVLVWCGVAYGVYAVAYELTRDRIASALGMVVALLITPVITLGGNTIIHNMLAPEGVGWALVLPGIALFLQKRWIPAGVILGLAAWFHLLAGGLTALVLGSVLLWRTFEKASGYGLPAATRFGVSFVVASLPVVIPVALAQGNPAPVGESPFYIHAVFRNPFHHLFFSFDTARHLRFWPLMILGGLSLWLLVRRDRVRHASEIARFWVVAFFLCCISVVFVEIVPVELVAKLQFFKTTVPSALFASLLLSAAITAWLPPVITKVGEYLLLWRRAGLLCATALCGVVLTLAVRGTNRPGALLYPVQHLQTELAEVEAWARTETHTSALFAIPPTVGTFRSFGERSVVANWYAFVFDDRAIQTWYERLMAIAPISRPARGADPKPELDIAYYNRSSENWLNLSDQFGINFVLTRTTEPQLALPEAFRNGAWVVYKLGSATPQP